MLRVLNVVMDNGTVLRGCLFHDKAASSVVIIVTGVEGNIHNNPFFHNIGKTLNQHGMDLIVAHTRDAFNQVDSRNLTTGAIETYGAWSEDFTSTDSEIQAYLTYARTNYQRIFLGGHSLGANKVIHYLANHPEAPIKKFILLSPVNVDQLRDSILPKQRAAITAFRQRGQGKARLPFKLFRWLSATADTGYQWLTNDTLNNVHIEEDGNFTQIGNIQQHGALIIGTRDGFTRGNPRQYLTNINNHFTDPQMNQLVFIPNTGHIYRRQEQTLANQIMKLIHQWN